MRVLTPPGQHLKDEKAKRTQATRDVVPGAQLCSQPCIRSVKNELRSQ
jgi:hypothetical protein